MIERYFAWILPALVLLFSVQSAEAQTRRIKVVSDDAAAGTGVWAFVLPRFSLKTGISVELIVAENARVSEMAMAGEADVFIAAGASGGAWRGVMFEGDPDTGSGEAIHYAAVLADPTLHAQASRPWAEKFMAWMMSDIGQRTIASFRRDGAQVFYPGAEEAKAPPPPPISGNAALGEMLALKNCGRCHVVSEKNRYGGIDSTPSFPGLRTISNWRERFEAFWTLNPHPSFTQIEGVTEPFDESRPPAIAPIRLTVDEVDDIGAFLSTIEPKDLGPALRID